MDRVDISDPHQISRAKLRKTTKPLLEKKRRARINSSLAQLKTLVLEAVKKDTARYSKLEKADVLDMTVRHLRAIQSRQLAAAMAADPSVLSKFRAGFSECVAEVSRYLSTIDGLEPEVRMRLMEHLATCMERRVTQQMVPPVNINMLQPIHIQIPPSGPRPGTLPGSYQPMTASSQTGSSPPIGSLPPQLQTVAMETAHPLMYGVSGSFHMIPNSMLYQDRLQLPLKSEQHKASLSGNKATDIKTSLVATSSPRAHHQLVTSKNMVKQEPVWRPW